MGNFILRDSQLKLLINLASGMTIKECADLMQKSYYDIQKKNSKFI